MTQLYSIEFLGNMTPDTIAFTAEDAADADRIAAKIAKYAEDENGDTYAYIVNEEDEDGEAEWRKAEEEARLEIYKDFDSFYAHQEWQKEQDAKPDPILNGDF